MKFRKKKYDTIKKFLESPPRVIISLKLYKYREEPT